MPIVKVLYFVDGRRKAPPVDSPTLAACSWPVPRLKGQEVNDTIGTEVVHQTLDGKANDSAVRRARISSSLPMLGTTAVAPDDHRRTNSRRRPPRLAHPLERVSPGGLEPGGKRRRREFTPVLDSSGSSH